MSSRPKKESEMKIVELNLSDIIPTSDNPREITTSNLSELVDSVKQFGVVSPVLVRPHPDKKGKYDLRAGARRLEAAKQAGLATIPANIKEMTDEQAFEVTFAENVGRSDLSPFEQAKSVEILLEKYDNDIEAVASKLCKSVREIKMLINVSSINPKIKNSTDETIKALTVSHLALVARMNQSVQEELLENAYYMFREDGKLISVKKLEKQLSDKNNKLSTACFGVAGCKECMKRTDHEIQKELWDSGKKKNSFSAACMDSSCWEEKFFAHIKETAKQLEADGFKVKYDGYDYKAMQKLKITDKLMHSSFFAKKVAGKTKDAYPVIDLKTGAVSWFKKPKEKNREDGEQLEGGFSSNSAKPDKHAALDSKRTCHVIKEVCANLESGSLPIKADIETIIRYAVLFGIVGSHDGELEYNPDKAKTLFKSAVISSVIKNVSWNGAITQLPEERKALLESVIEDFFGVDMVGIIFSQAKEEIPEPKSWGKK